MVMIASLWTGARALSNIRFYESSNGTCAGGANENTIASGYHFGTTPGCQPYDTEFHPALPADWPTKGNYYYIGTCNSTHLPVRWICSDSSCSSCNITQDLSIQDIMAGSCVNQEMSGWNDFRWAVGGVADLCGSTGGSCSYQAALDTCKQGGGPGYTCESLSAPCDAAQFCGSGTFFDQTTQKCERR